MSVENKLIRPFGLRKILLNYGSLILALIFLCWTNLNNVVPVNPGDGLAHFFIAQNVWNNPHELLSHWGKPLFTLLSSPFAFFGFKAYITFNILVFALTSLIGIKISNQLNASPFVSVVLPIALLSVPDYTSNVLGGLTEPLFGLLVVALGYFLLHKKWIWLVLIASMLPFSRSEGQFVVVLVGVILLLHRQWKFLPLLLVTWVIYAFAGLLALGDFWWYFTNDPYQGAKDLYGSGSWFHYARSWSQHFGWGGILLIGSLLLLIPRKTQFKKLNSTTLLLFTFAIIVYGGIVLSHAYLWANGERGAFGLSRLATHGIPLFFLVCLVAIDFLVREKKMVLVRVALAAVFLFVSYKSIRNMGYPRNPGEFETELINSAEYLKEIENQTNKIYYYHPLIALNVGSNLKDTTGVYRQKNFLSIDNEVKRWKGGEIVARDNHFGPMEMGLPLDNLGKLVRIRSFHAFTSAQSHLGEKYRVDIYQYQPGKTLEPSTIILSNNNITFSLLPDDMYHLVEEIQPFSIKQNAEILLEIEIKTDEEPSKPLYLVLQKKDHTGSQTYEINKETSIQISISSNHVTEMILFVYNPNQVSIPSISVETNTSLIELQELIPEAQ